MGILAWLVLGALAGWIAGMLVGKDEKSSLIRNIIVGIIGAFIGGALMNLIGNTPGGVTGLNLYSVAISVLGAVILLAIMKAIKK